MRWQNMERFSIRMKINSIGILGAGGAVALVGLAAILLSNKASAAQPAQQTQTNGEAVPVVEDSGSGSPVANVSLLGGIMNDSLASVGLSEPRGIRNNNPLNIRNNAQNKWVGQVGIDDKGFCVFDTPLNGIRAAAKILKSYSNNNVKTIRQIVFRWTSGDLVSTQNNYVNYVAGRLGVSADVQLNTNNWAALLMAMSYFENGKDGYSFDQFVAGVKAAGV